MRAEQQYIDLEQQMASDEAVYNPKKMQELAQERASLEEIVSLYRQYQKSLKALEETRSILNDSLDEDMLSMVKWVASKIGYKVVKI